MDTLATESCRGEQGCFVALSIFCNFIIDVLGTDIEGGCLRPLEIASQVRYLQKSFILLGTNMISRRSWGLHVFVSF